MSTTNIESIDASLYEEPVTTKSTRDPNDYRGASPYSANPIDGCRCMDCRRAIVYDDEEEEEYEEEEYKDEEEYKYEEEYKDEKEYEPVSTTPGPDNYIDPSPY